MTVAQALILGVVQGLTEFLPISSSGHLLIVQQWLGLTESLLTFDILIHLGTLVAILLFFGKSLFKVTFKEWLLVAIGTIPAVIVGVVLKDQIEAAFGADKWVGIELILTGFIILGTDRFLEKHKDTEVKNFEQRSAEAESQAVTTVLTPVKSFLVGVAQAIAIIPGISRSGSTVAGAVLVGLDREAAFRFSFLLAIPAIAGAGVLQLKDVVEAGTLADLWSLPYVVGAVAACVTGIASLALFRYVINKARLEWFAWYCFVLGAVVTWWMFT
jgi:undecaprenyl-diphosphatase